MLIKICRSSEIKTGKLFDFTENNIDFLAAKINNKFYAVINICPHQTRKMITPRLENNILYCEHHAIGYNIITGEVVNDSGYYDVAPLEKITLIEKNNYVFMEKFGE